MTRVLLINPPSPEQLGAPLLGLQYVAAALLAHGCEVRVIDAASRYFPDDADAVVAAAREFEPEIIGFGLFTRWVYHAYALVKRFEGFPALLVAGGAHATACPEETLRHGFDVAVMGEADATIVKIVEAVAGNRRLADVPGILFRDSNGTIRRGPAGRLVEDLDGLAFPQTAQDLFDPRWYGESGREVVPGGMLTSRGCPARCTFCANYVTGRRFRHRSSANVIAELNAHHERSGTRYFPFWDDALSADMPRLQALCAAMETGVRFDLQWGAITRANMVNPTMLQAMKRAGLVHVNFGVESGDDAILRAIKKGLNTGQVVRALEWAKAEGLRTAANFMLGFPQESPASLERTLRFMERIAPLVDTFSTMGVLVPFPGTPLYDDYHAMHGFTEWWLKEEYSRSVAPPPLSEPERFHRHYIDDANLELDFFHYSDEMRTMIRECLKYKGEHNLAWMGLGRDPMQGDADRTGDRESSAGQASPAPSQHEGGVA